MISTRGELLGIEINRMEAERGYYIPPYLMREMMRTADKIVDLLIRPGGVSYEECRIIMNIVDAALTQASKEKSPSGGNQTGKTE